MSGRLVIESSHPKAGGPEFTGSLADMRLRQLQSDGTTAGLQIDTCGQLQAFLRLRSKLQWTIEEFDAIIVTLSRSETFAINHTLLGDLAAVKQLADMTDTSPGELQPLWGDISTHGRNSLYARRFPEDPLQINRSHSGGEGAIPTITSRMESILSGLNITGTELKAILPTGAVPDRLSLATLSALYRISLLCKILDVPAADYKNLLAMYPGGFDPFETPKATQELVQGFTIYHQGPQPWSFDQLLFVVQGSYNISDSSCNLVVDEVLLLAAEVFSNLNTASTSQWLDLYTDDNVLLDHVSQLTTQLFGVENGRRISKFVINFETGTQTERAFFQQCFITLLKPEGTRQLLKDVSDQKGDNAVSARLKCFLATIMTVITKGRQQQIVIDSLRAKFPGTELSMLHFALSEVVQLAPEKIPGNRSLVSGMEAVILAASNPTTSENENFEGYFIPPSSDTYIVACNPDIKPAKLFVDGIELAFVKADTNSPSTTVTRSLMTS
jgi:hypothetical protein